MRQTVRRLHSPRARSPLTSPANSTTGLKGDFDANGPQGSGSTKSMSVANTSSSGGGEVPAVIIPIMSHPSGGNSQSLLTGNGESPPYGS
jgi:hypothetical protein